jgi:cytidylate kinase
MTAGPGHHPLEDLEREEAVGLAESLSFSDGEYEIEGLARMELNGEPIVKGYELTTRGADLVDSAPLPYRDPELLHSHGEDIQTGSAANTITVGGRSGTGSSTVADILGDELGHEVFHSTDPKNAAAEELFVESGSADNLEEAKLMYRDTDLTKEQKLSAIRETDYEVPDASGPEKAIDKLQIRKVFSENPVIVESRFAPYIAPRKTRLQIQTVANRDKVLERIVPRKGETPEETLRKRREFADLARNMYPGLDITDESVYDIEIDNTPEMNPERRKEIHDDVHKFLNEAGS